MYIKLSPTPEIRLKLLLTSNDYYTSIPRYKQIITKVHRYLIFSLNGVGYKYMNILIIHVKRVKLWKHKGFVINSFLFQIVQTIDAIYRSSISFNDEPIQH